MPDIAMRFDLDILVVSAPLDEALKRQGADLARDRNYMALFEPEGLFEALRLEKNAGAQCLVIPTADITPARLAQNRMRDSIDDIAHAACSLVAELHPQHVLAEIAPCGLPLDASSKA